ncbi:hypothetical protein, partial [Klebsiella pneumoniae]|uniref:hypothetical protein n=1 Tax=Klebsiella pneumoniae TaxID=573 RepID=UPI001A91D48B
NWCKQDWRNGVASNCSADSGANQPSGSAASGADGWLWDGLCSHFSIFPLSGQAPLPLSPFLCSFSLWVFYILLVKTVCFHVHI